MFERFLEILQSIATSLASIAVSMQTGAAVTSTSPANPAGNAPAAAADKTTPAKGTTAKTKAPAATGAAATAPAAATPSASTASSGTSATNAGEPTFQKVTDVCMAFAKKPVEEGGGREAFLAVLKHFLPGVEKPSLSMLQPLNKNAEIVAFVEAGGKAPEATDDDGMFN